MWKRGEIAPKEQFLLFSTLFYIYISNFRSQITYSFIKCGCSIYCFPHSLNSDMLRYGYLEVFQWVPWNSRKRESTVCKISLCGQRRLRLGGCARRFESSFRAYVRRNVFSLCISIIDASIVQWLMHHWGYSRKAIVAMDHLSFVQIFKKPLYFCPTCLQRVMIQMECYEIEVRFRVGKDIPV